MDRLSVTSLYANIAELHQQVASMQAEARTDALTGLGNRRAFDEIEGDGYFVVVDLNGFKAAQDRHPRKHSYGDEVLKHFAQFLVSRTRESYRVGGDEFALWCPNYKGALRIRNMIHRWEYGGVTASAGWGQTYEAADARMMQAKAERRAA